MSQSWRRWLQPSLKQLKRVVVRFDPMDPSVTGTREFLFQASNRQLSRSNPKCAVEWEEFNDHSPPYVEFEWVNGFRHKLLTVDKSADDIVLEMALWTRHVENTTGLGLEEELNEEDDEDEKKSK